MKRNFFLFAVVSLLGLTSVGCTSDDNSSSNFNQDIQGIWQESRILYLNSDRQVINQDILVDDGCGLGEFEFKGNVLTTRSVDYGLDGCETEEQKLTYFIKGDHIYSNEREENTRIVELTAKKLVLTADFAIEFQGQKKAFDQPELGKPDKNITEVHVEFRRK
ncbi:lipocalin family protein [Myroides fluvii]|uniref:lipocalin family protein n=1 Tax=Myroides fluvii TaxID=2572594 RepID=UPI00131D37AF|nr:lipocalin family protein [Myroides fluvii]